MLQSLPAVSYQKGVVRELEVFTSDQFSSQQKKRPSHF